MGVWLVNCQGNLHPGIKLLVKTAAYLFTIPKTAGESSVSEPASIKAISS